MCIRDSYEIEYKLVDDGHKDYDITYYTGRVADDELVPTLKKAHHQPHGLCNM